MSLCLLFHNALQTQYLDVPFLRLKQKSLQEQLALVERDLHSCHAHLTDTVRLSNYEDYLRKFEARKRLVLLVVLFMKI